MAYTYADFEKAANEAGMNGTFNDGDLRLAQRFPEYGLSLISLRRDLNNATTNEQKLLATEAENQLRKNYGSFNVTGSSYDGAGMTGTRGTQSRAGMPALSTAANGLNAQNTQSSDTGITGTAAGTKGTTAAGAGAANAAAAGTSAATGAAAATDTAGLTGTAKTAAESAGTETGPDPEDYTSDYVRLLDRVVNGQEAFSFDPFTDERYSAYKKAYNREGDRAAANALAAAAAATGGRPSSWASTAAQEANNYYAAKLADIIPTLRSEARSEYDQNFSQLLQQLNAAYQQERDQVADEQQDLQNALTIYQQTKTLVEPLKSILEAATANENSGVGGDGGFSYYGGGGSGSSGSKTAYDIGLEMGSTFGKDAAKVFADADRSGLTTDQQRSIYQGIVDRAGLAKFDK